MSYKKHVSLIPSLARLQNSMNMSNSDSPSPVGSNYSSFLPEVYAGHPRRIERYTQYDLMDTDSEVNAA